MSRLRIPRFPDEETINSLYLVSVDGNPVQVLPARVSAMPFNIWWPGHQRPLEQTETAGFISFEADGEISVSVTPLCQTLNGNDDIRIRPLSKGIRPSVCGNAIEFTIRETGAYTLEINGFHKALHIFVNPFKSFGAPENHTVIEFGPGIHRAGHIEIGSHTTVLIDPSAVIYGSITAIGADDIRILGYGILDGSEEKRGDNDCLLPYYPDSHKKSVLSDMIRENRDYFRKYAEEQRDLRGCVKLYGCRNAVVEGVVMRDSSTFALLPAGCSEILIDNVKTIGMWRYNSDGIDLFNCSDTVIKNCFLRNFDDCIVIKGYEGWDGGNNENITVENCVVWCDWGRALEYGAETNADEYRNIVMRNCDLIHGDAVMMDIQTHNRAEIHNCLFENIRAEFSRYQLSPELQYDDDTVYNAAENGKQPLLIAIPVCGDDLYCVRNEHGPVHDIVFRNIQILIDEDAEIPRCFFAGIDEKAYVSDIRIENVTVNGQKGIYDDSFIDRNEFAYNIMLTD